MLRKHLHETYMMTQTAFVKNIDYALKANDNARRTITVKKGNQIVAVVLTSHAIEQVDNEIERLEAAHQEDQFKIKDLKKQNEILQARLDLQNKISNKDVFPFN